MAPSAQAEGYSVGLFERALRFCRDTCGAALCATALMSFGLPTARPLEPAAARDRVPPGQSRIPGGALGKWTPVPGNGTFVPHPGKPESRIPQITHRVGILDSYAMGGTPYASKISPHRPL